MNNSNYKKDGANTNSSEQAQSQSAISSTSRLVKLPKVELKHFNGDPIKFQGFWGAFNATVTRMFLFHQ